MSVTAASGFRAAGVASGIKASGTLDLALVAADRPVPTAGVFTRNLVQAAPVRWSRQLLAAQPQATAVVLNSGNANAATGPEGYAAAARMATAVGEATLVCSTGLIGVPFPIATVEAAVPTLRAALARTPEAGFMAAQAIMTTDTMAKEATARQRHWTVGGMAKGAAMLHPDMATMLAVVTTDARLDPAVLRITLGAAVERTFNRLCVDGCMSTNDTVIVMASGASHTAPEATAFEHALTEVCASLAQQMAADAEGATRVGRIRVTGAGSEAEAVAAARAVALSDLVRTSLAGGRPYWGRVLAALGTSGVPLDPDRVTIAYGDVVVCRAGALADHDIEAAAKAASAPDVLITVDLGTGIAAGDVLTADLTHGYIDENMGLS